MRTVTVIGGGLAGTAAALRLADAGWSVRLLEATPRLGGCASSFRRDGMPVDTGQHVFLRCCTEYRGLLERLGVAGDTTLQKRLDVPVVRAADGRRSRLRRSRMPVIGGIPFHLAGSLATYSVVPVRDRVASLRAVLALSRLDPADAVIDEQSFGDWLARHGQSPAATEALWDLIGVATLNARAGQTSLALAAMVFQTGLLTDAGAADIGWSAVPLERLHDEAARAALDASGVELIVRTKARGIDATAGAWRVRSEVADYDSDAVVVATPPAVAEQILPSGAVPLAPGWSERLGAAPIVNLHLVFDRRVMDEEFLACVGSPLQWLFDRSAAAGLADGRQYVVASLSAADGVVDHPVAALRELALTEVSRVLPLARRAGLTDFFVTRERAATFRQAPGSARWRPSARTTMPDLAVAGAYTDTGWPATMEGAVRSGHAAAAALGAAVTSRTRSVAA
jgi:squalene-associated FAD-dependent desaturase